MRKPAKAALVFAGAAALVAAVERSHVGRRVSRRVGRVVRYEAGRWRGSVYRWAGRHPTDDVDDLTLADRVRSTIGPLEKTLDLPHVHVMVERGVVLLHGEVGTDHDRETIERAVGEVAGVSGVESYLHLGLLASDTRPSTGRGVPTPPSAARQALLDAARRAGVGDTHAAEAVRATLTVFSQRLPARERQHLLGHLPQDVRDLAAPPRHLGRSLSRLRSVHELVLAVIGLDSQLPGGRADQVVEVIVGELRRLVPDDASQVAAVLPGELRALWEPPETPAPDRESPPS